MDTIVEEIFSGQTFLLSFIAYSVGTIPIGMLLERFKAKNELLVNAANFILDGAKGYVVGSIALSLGSSLEIAAMCGLLAVLGACFPVWQMSSKSKGWAATLGALILVNWQVALFTLLGFAVGFLMFRRFSVGPLLGVLTGAISSFYLLDSTTSKIFVLLIFVVIVARHEDNFWRLFSGKAP